MQGTCHTLSLAQRNSVWIGSFFFLIKWHVVSIFVILFCQNGQLGDVSDSAENRSAGKFLTEINYRKPRGEESEMIGRNMQPAPRMPRAISAEITFARLSYRYGRIFPFFSSCKERWEKFQQMAEAVPTSMHRFGSLAYVQNLCACALAPHACRSS